MKDGVLWTYIALNFLFAGGGGVILAVALTTRNAMKQQQTTKDVAVNLLLSSTPLEAGLINAFFIFGTFLSSFPAILARTSRALPKLHGALVMVSGVFTMIVGLVIWYNTLRTRSRLSVIWGEQTANTQSLLQQTFDCCGYYNATSPAFVHDATCTNALVAAEKEGCVGPFGKFANEYMDIIFTGIFGIVAIDAMLVLAVACVVKDRKEKERYRMIDEKTGHGI